MIYSLAINRDGSLLATTCKDRKLRIIEPRTAIVVAVSVNLMFFFKFTYEEEKQNILRKEHVT